MTQKVIFAFFQFMMGKQCGCDIIITNLIFIYDTQFCGSDLTNFSDRESLAAGSFSYTVNTVIVYNNIA